MSDTKVHGKFNGKFPKDVTKEAIDDAVKLALEGLGGEDLYVGNDKPPPQPPGHP